MKWPLVNLIDVTEINVGKTPAREKAEYFGEGKSWVSIADMNGKVFLNKTKEEVTEEGIKSANMKIVRESTVLFSFKLSVGKVCITGKPLYTNEAIAALPILDENKLDTKYLYYAMQAQDFSHLGERAAKGLTLNKEKLKRIKIPLPSLPTQQKIAAILDQADALRKKDQQLLAKYDELLESIFYDMFGDALQFEKKPDVNKFYLSDIADITSGVAKNTNNIRAEFVEVPYMRVANVQDSHIVLDEVKSIKVSQRDFEKFLLKPNDILLTEGGDPDKLGRGAVWHNEISPCIHQNHIFRVRPNFGIVNPSYLSFHIGSRYGKSYFLKAAKQTTGIASINLTQLKNFIAIVPPMILQNKFETITKNIQMQKEQVIKQSKHSEDLFQSLLQKAFKGELVK